MIDFSFILINAEEKAGGLFDFDGTLPLTIFQFLVLMFLLERFLYKPFSEIGDIRSENLRDKADKAESTLTTANQLAKLYENEEGKTLFEIHLNPSGKGIPKFAVNNTGKKAYEALKSILDGGTEIDHFSPKEIKEALEGKANPSPRIAVTAAASTPFSFTSITVFWITLSIWGPQYPNIPHMSP